MRSDAGFTLIEVVVAFVVAALVVVAALQLFGGAFDGSARAERLSRALIAAESRMAAVGVTVPLRTGEERGDGPGGTTWRTSIAPYEADPALDADTLPVRAYEVTVTVGWQSGSSDAVTLRTVKIGPRGGRP